MHCVDMGSFQKQYVYIQDCDFAVSHFSTSGFLKLYSRRFLKHKFQMWIGTLWAKVILGGNKFGRNIEKAWIQCPIPGYAQSAGINNPMPKRHVLGWPIPLPFQKLCFAWKYIYVFDSAMLIELMLGIWTIPNNKGQAEHLVPYWE